MPAGILREVNGRARGRRLDLLYRERNLAFGAVSAVITRVFWSTASSSNSDRLPHSQMSIYEKNSKLGSVYPYQSDDPSFNRTPPTRRVRSGALYPSADAISVLFVELPAMSQLPTSRHCSSGVDVLSGSSR